MRSHIGLCGILRERKQGMSDMAANSLPEPFVCRCRACSAGAPSRLSRRSTLAGAGAALLSLAASRQASAQTTLSTDAALAKLVEGNKHFVANKLESFDDDLAMLRQKTVSQQEPFAAILSCADSRVPVEVLFDQAIGQLFVTRVAGNICTPEIIGSLEYGAAVLGTPLIMVLGHQGCGAVKAAIAGHEEPGVIASLFPPLRAAVERAGPDVDATVKANAQIQASLLRNGSPLLAELVTHGKLKIVAGYYSLEDGTVSLLG